MPPKVRVMGSSFWASHVPVLRSTEPKPVRMSPVPVQVAVPVLRIVRTVMSLKKLLLMSMPPLANSVPAPVIVPVIQVVRPETVRSPSPRSNPPDWV